MYRRACARSKAAFIAERFRKAAHTCGMYATVTQTATRDSKLIIRILIG